MPISLAPGAKGGAGTVRPPGATALKISVKKKKKKKKLKKGGSPLMTKSATAIQMLQTEKDQQLKLKGRKGRLAAKESGVKRASKRRMIFCGVLVAVIITCVLVGVIVAVLLAKDTATTTSAPTTSPTT